MVFLTFTITLTQFSAFSMEDDAGELVATFTAIELDENTAPVGFIINEAQEIKRLDKATELLQGASEAGWPVIGLEGSGESSGLDDAEFEGAGETQQIVPMVGDQLHVDPVRRDIVEDAVVGFCIGAPEPCAADMCCGVAFDPTIGAEG